MDEPRWRWLLAALLCWGGAAGADPASHRAAARAFYEVSRSQAPAATAAAIGEMIARAAPGLAGQREVIEEFARELVGSEAFAEASIDAYVELLGEDDLRALTELFSTPAYQRYRARRLDLVRRTTERVLELIRARLPELERRLAAAREAEQGGQR